jgi:uncharacterized protein (UPF0276 family)
MTECQPCWSGVGVGIVYNEALAEWLETAPGLVDAVSLIPETLWHESASSPRYRRIEAVADRFDEAIGDTECVFHGIGLSLGSGFPLDVEHLERVADAADHYRPLWYSEHLAAFRVSDGSNTRIHAGIGLPVPFDTATLNELVPKVAAVVARLGIPTLLENSAIYVDVPTVEMSEAQFLNRLCEETGAGVLLDLHNLMVNEVNLGWDAERYLDELDLTRVLEVHVAGGEMLGRWYTDAHSGACPERVFELLVLVVARAPALRLVTLEVHESRVEPLGVAGLDDQLARIRRSIGGIASDVA